MPRLPIKPVEYTIRAPEYRNKVIKTPTDRILTQSHQVGGYIARKLPEESKELPNMIKPHDKK